MDTGGIILRIVLILISLVTIAIVLLQSEKGDGGFASAFTGGQSNFMSSGKIKGYESRLIFFTRILIGVLICAAVLMAILQKVGVTL